MSAEEEQKELLREYNYDFKRQVSMYSINILC